MSEAGAALAVVRDLALIFRKISGRLSKRVKLRVYFRLALWSDGTNAWKI